MLLTREKIVYKYQCVGTLMLSGLKACLLWVHKRIGGEVGCDGERGRSVENWGDVGKWREGFIIVQAKGREDYGQWGEIFF